MVHSKPTYPYPIQNNQAVYPQCPPAPKYTPHRFHPTQQRHPCWISFQILMLMLSSLLCNVQILLLRRLFSFHLSLAWKLKFCPRLLCCHPSSLFFSFFVLLLLLLCRPLFSLHSPVFFLKFGYLVIHHIIFKQVQDEFHKAIFCIRKYLSQ